MSKSLPSVSVFFPCYNDERTIGDLIDVTGRILRKRGGRYEIIVVDDGSTDGSRQLLKKAAKEFSKLRLIFHKKNKGYGGALCSGFKKAKYEFVFYTDGDGQYDVGELELFIPLMTKDIDVVNGIKMERNDPFVRIVAGKAYNFFVRNIFGIKIFDVDCDFRLIRKKLLKKIVLTSSSGAICVELIKKLQDKGARFREVTVHHYDRKFGNSQFFQPLRLIQTAVELIKLRLELI
ncbi:glycosyltransferase family 2 protein [Candidatus Jorgensenbacteria bacterium]|nr:glycosyltransferase family 2 protein [Candidatus Jorgensenbacteria bacterium]